MSTHLRHFHLQQLAELFDLAGDVADFTSSVTPIQRATSADRASQALAATVAST
jgi:hypothetical protein